MSEPSPYREVGVSARRDPPPRRKGDNMRGLFSALESIQRKKAQTHRFVAKVSKTKERVLERTHVRSGMPTTTHWHTPDAQLQECRRCGKPRFAVENKPCRGKKP